METRNVNKTPSLNALNTPAVASESAAAAKAAKPNLAGMQAEGKSAVGSGAKGVNVALSDQSRELSGAHKKALDIARNTPDVRADRVAELKKQIAEGTYQVDSGKVADGIMREAILDHLSQREN